MLLLSVDVNTELILASIRKIIRALNLESKRIQKEFGISIPQLLCLNYLKNAENYQANTKTLSQALNLNPSTISGIVKRLEKKSLIARLPKGKDKRVSIITLTADGAQLLEDTPELFHQKLDERLASLKKDDVDKVREGLSIITHLLEVNDIDAAPLLSIEDSFDAPDLSKKREDINDN